MRRRTGAAGTRCWASSARRSASSSPPRCSAYLLSNLSSEDFLDWGWRYPFYVAFAINVVALFARLRLVSTQRIRAPAGRARAGADPRARDLALAGPQRADRRASPRWPATRCSTWSRCSRCPGSCCIRDASVSGFLVIQIVGAALGVVGMVALGPDRRPLGRRNTLGTLAVLIAVFSGFVPDADGRRRARRRTSSSWSASRCWGCRMARRPAR